MAIESFIFETCSSVSPTSIPLSLSTSPSSVPWSTVSGISRSSGTLMLIVLASPSTFVVTVKFCLPSTESVFCTSPMEERSVSQFTALVEVLIVMLIVWFLSFWLLAIGR